MNEDRPELARSIAMLVSHELLGEYNMLQAVSYERDGDKLVFPATADRPDITVPLPLALQPSRIRELVRDALDSYIARLLRTPS